MTLRCFPILLLLASLDLLRAGGSAEKYADLLEKPPAVSAADNGWLLLKDLPEPVRKSGAGKLVVFPASAREDKPMGVDQNLLNDFKADNAKLISMVKTLLQRTGWSTSTDASQREIGAKFSALMFGAKVLLADAVVRAQKGEVDQAWREALEFMKLGQRINRSGGTLLQTAVGSGIVKFAVTSACWIGQLNPDATTLIGYAKALEPFEELGETVPRTIRADFRYDLDLIEKCQQGGEPLKRHLVEDLVGWTEFAEQLKTDKPAPKAAHEESVAKWMKDPPESVIKDMEALKSVDYPFLLEAVAANMRKEIQCKASTLEEYYKAFPRPASKGTGATGQTSYVECMRDPASFSPYMIRLVAFEQIAQVRLARVALILKAWALTHNGNLPESLVALIPKYLPSLPKDPFDGQTLRYYGAERRLWTVGKDLKDGGQNDDQVKQAVLE